MIAKLIHIFTPPPAWRTAVIILLGMIAGLGLHIIHISNAFSYLSDKPETCINCHVMRTAYATWQHSSHSRGIVCNDCHVPHNNALNKYFFKAKDGLRHSFIFTFRLEPQVIRIKDAGRHVVYDNCLRCHERQINPIAMRYSQPNKKYLQSRAVECWQCHRETPHSRVGSLSAAFDARIPRLPVVMPAWLSRLFFSGTKQLKFTPGGSYDNTGNHHQK